MMSLQTVCDICGDLLQQSRKDFWVIERDEFEDSLEFCIDCMERVIVPQAENCIQKRKSATK